MLGLKRKEAFQLIAIFIGALILGNLLFRKKEELDMENIEKTWDSKTDAKIKTLHPVLRPKAAKFINEVEKRLSHRLRITDGLRTFAEQNKLYAQGRTAPGKKVTQVQGGGSYHNFGLAFDCYFTKDGKVTFDKAITPEVAAIGKELGLDWGGAWKSFKDYPHFELNKGKTSELLAKYNAGKKDSEGYVIV